MWRIAIDVALDDVSASTPEIRRRFYETVLDNLHDAGATRPDLSGNLAQLVTISIAIEAGGICQAFGAIRAAVHGAGGCTPDWPNCDQIDATVDETGTYKVEFKSQSLQPAGV